ncbi:MULTISPECIES: UvrD-helicase domain-containing protein [Clostridium]|uniref:UvrD-helicase domain-containing protein n=1 Tax=Clostridium TaxID=1485 RepID=UPI0008A34F25|nr:MULTISPECIES: UvrD-helicase domain-containing protein [Clostridium]MBO1687622.1 UvrD-helicase domain-containing protein [Clostridium butyricum]MCQ2014500.1 UvrD-helicase domain-containing protein [Clostridium butyricum]MCQ2026536.1 UvrD-helicase domain-containing protein [Clostridium butyricum]MDI9207314.1 UvrD-helicase domain-containing protein [Clostridium butyricum]MDU0322841.1 3'-5' exonuclease [Clostridium butyricum]
MLDLKNLLNKEQYEGATTIEGQVLILAGAGSGKTRVLTHRIAHMVEDLNIAPYNILAITFTNKAAKEMKDRVRALIGECAENMWISTFHSTCVKILRREIDKIGYKSSFTIYDSSDQKTLVKECMKTVNINDKDISEQEIISKIGKAKDRMQTARSFKLENESNFRENKIADVYEMYQKRLKENNALDFDDLIFKTVELFKSNPETLEFYQRKFKYIMVDEYQDTNGAQYELVKLLASKYKNICVVGDDDQCLVEGTMVSTENKDVEIEKLMKEDLVRVASGNGETSLLKISDINKKKYCGKIVKITTKNNRVIKATPNHISFGKISLEEDKYYVYLMYKSGFGYRIGQTSSVRSRDDRDASGLAIRLNGEQADKMWIIKVCDTKGDATYYEQYYSVKYGIPTIVFNSRGRNITISQEQIEKMFKEIDTINAAEKLMEDEFLYNEYPHHLSNAVIRGDSIRKRVNLSFFGGKKSVQRGIYSHRIGLNSSADDSKNKFIEAGFNVRDGQRNTYRVETERALYDEAEEFARKLSMVEESFEILKKAKLSNDKSFMFMPIGSFKPGMSIAIQNSEKIEEDIVISVELEDYDGYVYDLNIDNARNYIANGIVVHNCIYQWRGADIKNILDFEKDYPDAKVIKLEQNYRSKGNILNAANVVIVNNSNRKSKALRTEQELGSKIKVYRAYSDSDEGDFVGKQILDIRKNEDKKYNDFAILYRTNAQSRIFEESFRRKGIPYKIVGGTRFYDRKEIKDILAYLKVLINPQDDISIRRIINVPKRSIGDATVNKIQDFADSFELNMWDALSEVRSIPTLTPRNVSCIDPFVQLMENLMILSETTPVSMLIETILEDTGYMDQLKKSNEIEDKSRIENLKELVSDAVDFEKNSEDKSLSAYLEKVSLVQDTDKIEDEDDSVVLMTVHSAKGLEFPVVFMVGMENGIFPGSASFEKESEMEESRRLCYVGITRAKEILFMTSAEVRRVFGKTVAYSQSDFINEIKPDLKEYVSVEKTGIKSRESFINKSSYNNPHSLRNNMTRTVSGSGLNASRPNSIGSSSIGNISSGDYISVAEATMGRKVMHEKFGVGTIVSVQNSGDDKKLTIAFDKQGVKVLLLSFAKLKMI